MVRVADTTCGSAANSSRAPKGLPWEPGAGIVVPTVPVLGPT
jgi:hypothetical protein